MTAGVHCRDARAPEGMRLYAIGDVHGRFDLMTAMHGRIMQEIMRDRPADWRVVYVGDYVDRGPDSAKVIEFLSRTTAAEPRVIALAGNHDVGFVEFLDSPSAQSTFAANGGEDTAASYGVALDFAPPEALARGHAALLDAMPDTHISFMRALPLSASFGDFFFCHAGIRPGVPLDRQDPHDLLWIRETFRGHAGLHPKLVVHGHTPVEAAELLPNRINLDTGAWFSGLMTAVALEGADKRLLEVDG